MFSALRTLRFARPLVERRAFLRPQMPVQVASASMSTSKDDDDAADPEDEGVHLARMAGLYKELDDGVRVPWLFDTLEWTLASPPPFHQFEEPPIIVEVEHLLTGDEVAKHQEKVSRLEIIDGEPFVDGKPAEGFDKVKMEVEKE